MAEEKKLSYEELENYAKQLTQQFDMMRKQMESMQLQEVVARLNFLFKVVELAKHFNKEYVSKCVEEIQRILVMEKPETGEPEVEEIEAEAVNA